MKFFSVIVLAFFVPFTAHSETIKIDDSFAVQKISEVKLSDQNRSFAIFYSKIRERKGRVEICAASYMKKLERRGSGISEGLFLTRTKVKLGSNVVLKGAKKFSRHLASKEADQKFVSQLQANAPKDLRINLSLIGFINRSVSDPGTALFGKPAKCITTREKWKPSYADETVKFEMPTKVSTTKFIR